MDFFEIVDFLEIVDNLLLTDESTISRFHSANTDLNGWRMMKEAKLPRNLAGAELEILSFGLQ